MKTNHDLIFLISNIMIPLLFGTLLYCLLSETKLIFMNDMDLISLIPVSFRSMFLPRLIRNHVPDMCWSYAMVFALYCITGKDLNVSFAVAFCFAMITEFLQIFENITGTFDVLDILFESMAILLAVYIIQRRKEK